MFQIESTIEPSHYIVVSTKDKRLSPKRKKYRRDTVVDLIAEHVYVMYVPISTHRVPNHIG